MAGTPSMVAGLHTPSLFYQQQVAGAPSIVDSLGPGALELPPQQWHPSKVAAVMAHATGAGGGDVTEVTVDRVPSFMATMGVFSAAHQPSQQPPAGADATPPTSGKDLTVGQWAKVVSNRMGLQQLPMQAPPPSDTEGPAAALL